MNKITQYAVDKTKETYHHIFRDYAYRNAQPNTDVKEMLEYFAAHVSGHKILDVGCAEGRETEYLSKKGFEVTGCDISEDFVELARKRCPLSQFFVADMRHLPDDLQMFDGIWACASFLHIPKEDASSTLQGFRRILKNGGLLYVSVLEGDFDGMRTNEKMRWPERHFSDYMEKDLLELMRRSGFTIITLRRKKYSKDTSFLHCFASNNEEVCV
jgi:SAM-dependent methyltransferase